MPTLSGTISFDMSARNIITFALRKINILSTTEDPSADDAARAMQELNMMLKSWEKYEQIWRLTEGFVQLIASTQSYNLIPIPYRIIDMRFRNSSGNDLPMWEMNRTEYYDLPRKDSDGPPTTYFFDRQRDTTAIYVWPVPSVVTTETLRVTYQRRFQDIDHLDDEIDCPHDYLSLVGYNLASRLTEDFGRSGNHVDRIVARAQQMLEDALDDDREDAVQFVPGYHFRYY